MTKLTLRRVTVLVRAHLVALLILPALPHAGAVAQEGARGMDVGAGAEQGPRIALVIGNAAYGTSPLKNPANDAADIASALRAFGFDVSLGQNWSKRQMEDAIYAFGQKLKRGGVGLFYFSGHGMQVEGKNYLIPIGCRVVDERDVEFEAVDADRVLGKMDAAANGMNLMILDACRDNPFARSFRTETQGLAQMRKPAGTYIAYATAPGSVAADGDGRNGTYTAALLKEMRVPGLKVEEVFKNVRSAVSKATAGKQRPWDESSLEGDFYFVAPAAAPTSTGGPTVPSPRTAAPVVIDPKAVEREYWNTIKDSTAAADFEAYLREYPAGSFASLARLKIGRLGTSAKPGPVRPAPGGGTSAPIVKPVEPAPIRPGPANGGRPVPAVTRPSAQGGARSFDLGGGVWVDMVLVEAGTFTMGSLNGDSDEQPIHRVTISKPYYLGSHEVTQQQWAAVMATSPSSFKGSDLPVENVSWEDVQEFLAALNAETGGGWRLPTEAEWEYACRAGTTGDHAGDVDQMAWYTANSDNQTHPVGRKRANGWGLYDMHGNVWEWCQDSYGAYKNDDQTDSMVAAGGSNRVNRGGGWNFTAAGCRSANRYGNSPGDRGDDLGFRIARNVDGIGIAASPPVRPASSEATTAPTPVPARPAIQGGAHSFEIGSGVSVDMVLVEPGTFTMGSLNGDPDEQPIHRVTISNHYYLGTYEVTQEQWKAVMGTNPSNFKGSNLPVEMVSWDDIQEFLRALNAKTGGGWRLPTEAEWEYACRAGSTGDFAGDLDQMGWYNSNAAGTTHPVGQKRPNGWGLYDMHGNVWEWCQDRTGSYARNDQTDPAGATVGTYRVRRGGSWYFNSARCRSAYRDRDEQGERRIFLGFRLARSADRAGAALPATNLPEPIDVRTAVPAPGMRVNADTAVDLGNGVRIEMVTVPAGSFKMGSNNGSTDEMPLHRVAISKPFLMGKFEVTQAQWRSIMGTNPSKFPGNDEHPVEQVSWGDCQEFIRRLNEKTGLMFRLPTEAEWEYACRSGTTGDHAGDLDQMAWYSSNSLSHTHAVGQKSPNAWGLYDMHGNVWEWCSDLWGGYTREDTTDPAGAGGGWNRVYRGGSWYNNAANCRSARRYGAASGSRIINLGFRLARSVEGARTSEHAPAGPALFVGGTAVPATSVPPPRDTIVDLGSGVRIEMAHVEADTAKVGSPE